MNTLNNGFDFHFFKITSSNAWIFFSVLLLFSLVVGVPTAEFQIVNSFASLFVILAYLYAAIKLLWLPLCCKKKDRSSEDKLIVENEFNNDLTIAAPLQPSGRLYYLDSIKAILTIVVVIHHVIGAFVGFGSVGFEMGGYHSAFQPFGIPIQLLDQAWFMSAFFFISAYFSPSSLDKKGAKEFMKDKIKRLGLPLFFYFFVLGPCITFIAGGHTYIPTTGPCWFLFFLLVFNTAYVMIGGPNLVRIKPSMLWLSCLGLFLGVIQALEMAVLPFYFVMPITFGSLPFDIVFWLGGIFAKRNRWMESLPEISRGQIGFAYTVVILVSGAVFSLASYVYTIGGGYVFMCENSCNNPNSTLNGVNTLPYSIKAAIVVSLGAVLGLFCMCMMVVALDFSRRYLNFTSPFMNFLVQNAYTVYLIHPIVVVPLTISYMEIMIAFGSLVNIQTISGTDQPANRFNCISPPRLREYDDYFVYAGFFYTAILSLLIVFPLAFLIRKVPFLKDIL